MKTIFGLVRHGVTDWNQQKRIQGTTDVPLNKEGMKQAHLLAARLKTESWDYIYSSDLSRAHTTAKIIGAAMDEMSIYVDRRLREKTFGEAEGTTEQERIARWGENWRTKAIGVETSAEVCERGQYLIDELRQKHEGKRILLVTHGAWIVSVLEQMKPESELPFIGNTSITIVEFDENGWSIPLVGCQTHL